MEYNFSAFDQQFPQHKEHFHNLFSECDSEQRYYIVIVLLQAPSTKNISNINDRIKTGLEHGYKIWGKLLRRLLSLYV